MNIILMQKTYAILVKDSFKAYTNGSEYHQMHRKLVSGYRSIIREYLMGRYFSTKSRHKLKVIDVSFYQNGHITIHGTEDNSQTYRNYAYYEVTFL